VEQFRRKSLCLHGSFLFFFSQGRERGTPSQWLRKKRNSARRRSIGEQIAGAGIRYGLDILNTLFLTPLPGTRLWDEMEANGCIGADAFPEDWQYYTLQFPVARYRQFSREDIVREMETCDGNFYSSWNILRRVWGSFWQRRKPLITLVGNLSCRSNYRRSCHACRNFLVSHATAQIT
jgi:hypothetical protein